MGMTIVQIGERLEELLYAEKIKNYYRAHDMWHFTLDTGEMMVANDAQILLFLASMAEERAQTMVWSDVADIADGVNHR